MRGTLNKIHPLLLNSPDKGLGETEASSSLTAITLEAHGVWSCDLFGFRLGGHAALCVC